MQTNEAVNCAGALLRNNAFDRCPPKTYGKAAFTPEVPGVRLVNGKLANAPKRKKLVTVVTR